MGQQGIREQAHRRPRGARRLLCQQEGRDQDGRHAVGRLAAQGHAGRSVAARLGRAFRAGLGASLFASSTGSRRGAIAWRCSASSNWLFRSATARRRSPTAQLVVENQSLIGHTPGDGTMRFPFLPEGRQGLQFHDSRATCPLSMERTGGITACTPTPDIASEPSPRLPNWWTDDPSPEFAEDGHIGAKTVNRWREEFLRDFAKRMARCAHARGPANGEKYGFGRRIMRRPSALGPTLYPLKVGGRKLFPKKDLKYPRQDSNSL